MSINTWTVLSSTGPELALTAAHMGLYVQANKTGSPGGLYLFAPMVWVT